MSLPLILAAKPAAEAAENLSGGIVKALSTAIYSRKRTEVWDAEAQEWVPLSREREANLTVGAVFVGGLLALGAFAVGQRGLRSGMLEPVPAVRKVKAVNPEWEQWRIREDARANTYGTNSGYYDLGARGDAQRRQAAQERASASALDPQPAKTILVDDPTGKQSLNPLKRFRLHGNGPQGYPTLVGKLV
jgi:hypothetical protein